MTLTFCPHPRITRFGAVVAGNLTGSDCEGRFRRITSRTALWEYYLNVTLAERTIWNRGNAGVIGEVHPKAG